VDGDDEGFCLSTRGGRLFVGFVVLLGTNGVSGFQIEDDEDAFDPVRNVKGFVILMSVS